MRITVNSIKCGITRVGGEYFGEEPQGQYCRVNVTMANIGDEERTIFADDQKLVDTKGREFSYDSGATMIAGDGNDSDLSIGSINPGNKVKGDIYYDIPKGAKPVTMLVTRAAAGSRSPSRCGSNRPR